MPSTKPPAAKKKMGRPLKNPPSNLKPVGILIVDDEAFWRQLCKMNIHNLEEKPTREYIFFEAENGRDAAKIIAQNCRLIKIVILDLRMRKMEGLELLKLLVDDWGLGEDLGIWVVTAYATEENIDEAQLRGVKGFYDKVFTDFARLSRQIGNYLNIKEKSSAKETGFYREDRPAAAGDYKYVFLRWQPFPDKWATFCIGRDDEIEKIDLPHMRTKPPAKDDDNS